MKSPDKILRISSAFLVAVGSFFGFMLLYNFIKMILYEIRVNPDNSYSFVPAFTWERLIKSLPAMFGMMLLFAVIFMTVWMFLNKDRQPLIFCFVFAAMFVIFIIIMHVSVRYFALAEYTVIRNFIPFIKTSFEVSYTIPEYLVFFFIAPYILNIIPLLVLFVRQKQIDKI